MIDDTIVREGRRLLDLAQRNGETPQEFVIGFQDRLMSGPPGPIELHKPVRLFGLPVSVNRFVARGLALVTDKHPFERLLT